jgi:hypothetical protein
LKLENLLAPYLYQHKKLNLPGIGTFEADSAANTPEAATQNIRFIQNIIAQPDDEFIEYIKTRTGKMKPLAISDLESYLMLSKQFLNIGKPFQIEGIGTLQKMKDGSFQFTREEYVPARAEGTALENAKAEKRLENKEGETLDKSGAQRALILLALIATIALIGWGGYYLYERNTIGETTDTEINSITSIPDSVAMQNIQPDSSMLIKDTGTVKPDSAMTGVAIPALPGNIKFILETTSNKARALARFIYINKINNNIHLETKADSSLFKIFVTLPATQADTSRIKDSLNAWYYGKREMKISIE